MLLPILLALLAPATAAAAQTDPPPPKRALASRLEAGPVRIDGRLDEASWSRAAFLVDFRLKEPVEHGEPTDRTEVAFLYDDHALYIGARLRSRNPEAIPRSLTRRDQSGNAEHLTVTLDPFLDRRTAYSFSITSGGVRRDYYHATDQEFDRDYTFDPVWDARVAFDSLGWTAEIRIPFSQLRFANRSDQRWGLNINRWVPTRNEDAYWVVVPRNETGYVSRFGTLGGLDGIRQSRRIEVLPYLASSGTFSGKADPANALDPDGRDLSIRGGADLKMGLGPNLTLDATINPDFGQVEADPAEVNLTAFETFFDERRPFFTEGSQLLSGGGGSYFYSRRIGGAPRGEATGDYTRVPANTTILGAAKLTGNLGRGLSIGALAAATDHEFARTYDSLPNRFGRTMVEPRSQFGVIRLQQQFGRESSTVGVIVAGMNRGFGGDSVLPTVLSRRAVAGGADWLLRFQGGRYVLSGDLGGSWVEGDPTAITAIQRSSAHYFQRPDFRGGTALDPAATTLTGMRARLRADKNAGNWLWGAEVSTESPGFETNDMGRLQDADDIAWNADVNHRWTVPGKLFRSATVGLLTTGILNYDGVLTSSQLTLFTSQTWANFMMSDLNATCQVRAQSDHQTRGGPLMATPFGCQINGELEANYAAATQWEIGGSAFRSETGDWQLGLRAELTVRPTAALSVSIEPSWSNARETRQYITTLPNGTDATYGERYLFGSIRRSTLVAQLRVNYTVTPDLTIEAYAEPFAASGKYTGVGELAAPRTRQLREYGRDGTTILATAPGELTVLDQSNGETFTAPVPDFNVLSFRSNLVLRWEWRRGSTMYLVWQQSRSSFCTPGDPAACPGGLRPGSLVRPGSLTDALRATGDNFLAIKLSYWLPFS